MNGKFGVSWPSSHVVDETQHQVAGEQALQSKSLELLPMCQLHWGLGPL